MRRFRALGLAAALCALGGSAPALAEGEQTLAPVPSPDASAAPAAAKPPASFARGAIVVASDEAARPHAKELARLVYRDAKLRPVLDEQTARALAGEAGRGLKGQAAEVAAVVKAIASSRDDSVRRRLLASVGKELGAQLIVLVVDGGTAGPRARVVRLPEGRFLAVTLTAVGPPAAGVGWNWSDAVAILRELASGPAPGPRRTKPAEPEEHKIVQGADEDDWAFLSSPWFWGGLGVVVSVGVTVLVLSQTSLNDPDVVSLQGQVSP